MWGGASLGRGAMRDKRTGKWLVRLVGSKERRVGSDSSTEGEGKGLVTW